MCFSATASFLSAGVTGVIGLAAVARARTRRELPMAAVPLVFSAQQTVEGLLWLTLPNAPDGPATSALTLAFLLFAEVLWPVYAPLAALLIEPSARRARALLVCLLSGTAVAGYLLIGLLTGRPGAVIDGGHIVYDRASPQPEWVLMSYLLATTLALALSSWPVIRVLASVIAIGYGVAYFLYWNAFISVWCFFAAAASVIVLAHFEMARVAAAERVGRG
ncbi:MAG: DUF6629 family protein [Pseudomonadota bacterium]